MPGKTPPKGPARAPSRTPLIAAIALGVVALVGLFSYAVYKDKTAPKPPAPTVDATQPGQEGCTGSAVTAQLPGVERVPCINQSHVPEGTDVIYPTSPPLSGRHWASWVQAGHYASPQPEERLVHSLEHGNVVIWYNRDKLSGDEFEAVKDLAGKYRGQWDGVVTVPNKEQPQALILTAWEHVLRLDRYDQARVTQFVDTFRGRGPENPVR